LSTLKLHFANNTVAIFWKDEPSGDLAHMLFGSQPTLTAAEPRVQFTLASDRQSGQISLTMDTTPQDVKGPQGQIAVRLLDLVGFHLADRSKGGLLFHAACLSREGKAWLFPGPAGSGKSSLALWLTSQGFAYHSDELTFLPLGGQLVQGFFRAIYLKKPALGLFSDFDQTEWFPVEAGGGFPGGALIPPDWAGQTGPQAELPIERILFPSYQAGGRYALEPLTKADAALELSKALVNARNLPNRGFPDVVRLVRSIPTYRFTYGSFDQIQVSNFGTLADG
jgi:hypothetical protein